MPLYECEDVVNNGSRPISGFQVQFTHGSAGGATLAVDTMNVRTTLEPGAALETRCYGFSGRTSPGVFHYAKFSSQGTPDQTPPTIIFKGQRSTLSAAVTEVYF